MTSPRTSPSNVAFHMRAALTPSCTVKCWPHSHAHAAGRSTSTTQRTSRTMLRASWVSERTRCFTDRGQLWDHRGPRIIASRSLQRSCSLESAPGDADPARGRLPFGDLTWSTFVLCGSPATSRRSSGTPGAFGSRWGADGGARRHTRGKSVPSARLLLTKCSDYVESAIFRVLPERRSFLANPWSLLWSGLLPVIQRMGVDFDNRHQVAQAVEYRIDVARRMSDRPLSGRARLRRRSSTWWQLVIRVPNPGTRSSRSRPSHPWRPLPARPTPPAR